MLSKNQMSTLYVTTAPALIAFLQGERQKLVSEIERLRKRESKKQRGGGSVGSESGPQANVEPGALPVVLSESTEVTPLSKSAQIKQG